MINSLLKKMGFGSEGEEMDYLPVYRLKAELSTNDASDLGGFEGFIDSGYSMDESLHDTRVHDGYLFYTVNPESMKDFFAVAGESYNIAVDIEVKEVSRKAYLKAKKAIDYEIDDESEDITLPEGSDEGDSGAGGDFESLFIDDDD